VRTRKTVLAGLIVVMVLGLAACGDDGDDENVLGERPENADLVINDEHPFYEPTKLTMPLNREVTITVFNEGDAVHNITIPGLSIEMDVPPKQSVEIKLPAVSEAPRDGFFTVYCRFHQSEGEALRLEISR
jgi:plastocyanin